MRSARSAPTRRARGLRPAGRTAVGRSQRPSAARSRHRLARWRTRTPGLPKALVQELSGSRWVAAQQTVVITGPTGVGKSYLACALAHKACRDGFPVAYRRVSRLYDELAQARADGTYLSVLRRLAKVQVADFGHRERPDRSIVSTEIGGTIERP